MLRCVEGALGGTVGGSLLEADFGLAAMAGWEKNDNDILNR